MIAWETRDIVRLFGQNKDREELGFVYNCDTVKPEKSFKHLAADTFRLDASTYTNQAGN